MRITRPACALAGAASLLIFHSRSCVRDGDAYAYITGAMQMRAGHGYIDLLGNALNHFAPGYSLLLAIFPNQLLAAALINALAFGAACVLLFELARAHEWTVAGAASLSIALGAGFFRIVATNAKPDVLCYALFLGALLAQMRGRRTTTYALLLSCVALKLIAIAFVPAFVLHDFLKRRDARALLPLLPWALMVGLLIAFDVATIGVVIPQTHARGGVSVLLREARAFLASLPRDLLAPWYGSVRSGAARFFFLAQMATAVGALFTLRARRTQTVETGLLVLMFTAGMELLRDFGGQARLTAYGVLAIVTGARPTRATSLVWPVYACIALLAGVVNALTVPSNGASDVVYEQLARAVSVNLPRGIVATNSFHILDIHAARASMMVSPQRTPANIHYYLDVGVQIPDPQSTVVVPVQPDTMVWQRYRTFAGAVLYQRR